MHGLDIQAHPLKGLGTLSLAKIKVLYEGKRKDLPHREGSRAEGKGQTQRFHGSLQKE